MIAHASYPLKILSVLLQVKKASKVHELNLEIITHKQTHQKPSDYAVYARERARQLMHNYH